MVTTKSEGYTVVDLIAQIWWLALMFIFAVPSKIYNYSVLKFEKINRLLC